MRLIFAAIILLGVLGLLLGGERSGGHAPWLTVTGGVKATDIINVVLMAALVLVTIYYAYSTAQSVNVSRDMAVQMQRANAINYRPYVLIEELSAEQLAAMEAADPRNIAGAPAKTRAYPIGRATEAEYVFYNLRNLGNVPAHDMKHATEVRVLDERTGQVTTVPIQPTPETTEALLPQQVITRLVKVPRGTFFRDDADGKVVSVNMKVTFSGVRAIDPNRYFYTVTLRSRAVKGVEEMNRAGVGGVTVEQSDEGIEVASE